MVYHDLPMEEGQKRFEELNVVPISKPAQAKEKPKRKVVKALVPKNK
jgi:hypothetical protein